MVTVVWKLWDMKRLQLIDRKIIDQTVGKQTCVSVEVSVRRLVADTIKIQMFQCFSSLWTQVYNKKAMTLSKMVVN